MPALADIIGGVIAYYVLRHDDAWYARACLYVGIIKTAISIFATAIIVYSVQSTVESLQPGLFN